MSKISKRPSENLEFGRLACEASPCKGWDSPKTVTEILSEDTIPAYGDEPGAFVLAFYPELGDSSKESPQQPQAPELTGRSRPRSRHDISH